jgi:hypothetical protein
MRRLARARGILRSIAMISIAFYLYDNLLYSSFILYCQVLRPLMYALFRKKYDGQMDCRNPEKVL